MKCHNKSYKAYDVICNVSNICGTTHSLYGYSMNVNSFLWVFFCPSYFGWLSLLGLALVMSLRGWNILRYLFPATKTGNYPPRSSLTFQKLKGINMPQNKILLHHDKLLYIYVIIIWNIPYYKFFKSILSTGISLELILKWIMKYIMW